MMEEQIQMNNSAIRNPHSELPQGWRWVKLGEVCEVVTGATPRTNDPITGMGKFSG